MPNFGIEKFGGNKINLGLDLSGGVHFLLDVDFDSYLKDKMHSTSEIIKKELRANKMGYKNFKITSNSISFSVRDNDDSKKAKGILKKLIKDFVINFDDNVFRIELDESAILDMRRMVVDQSMEVIRMRVDSAGTKEPLIQSQGESSILLQIPGEDDPEKLKTIIGKTAKLGFHTVNEDAHLNDRSLSISEINLPKEYIALKTQDERGYLVVKKNPEITGSMLRDASVSFDQYNQACVSIAFNDEGAKLFADVTRNNIGKRLAIVLDNKILSAPAINSPIIGGSGIISGNFSMDSANELALLLRAGSLIAPISIVEERTVGPTLGNDSIENGKRACIAGFVFVSIFMLWIYAIPGLIANIALAFAMYYIFGLLSVLNATLTLAGIAGLILTIGMAVDANVLIYERIREYSRLNKIKSAEYCLHEGFKSAFNTIFDSNITTLICALFLYIFGTGTVRGFAVTLSVGIVASMFASIIITRMLMELWIKLFKPKKVIL